MKRYNVKRDTVIQPADDSYRLIPLQRGITTMVSAHRFEYLMQWNWNAQWCRFSNNYRVARTDRTDGVDRRISLPRFIMGLVKGDGKEVDHINRNTLDNRDENLRVCTRSENAANQYRRVNISSTGYKGVLRLRSGRFEARLTYKLRIHYLGKFDTPEEAARAYDAAALKLLGPFAALNFP